MCVCVCACVYIYKRTSIDIYIYIYLFIYLYLFFVYIYIRIQPRKTHLVNCVSKPDVRPSGCPLIDFAHDSWGRLEHVNKLLRPCNASSSFLGTLAKLTIFVVSYKHNQDFFTKERSGLGFSHFKLL